MEGTHVGRIGRLSKRPRPPHFTNAFSGGGVWKDCTLDGKAVQGYSGGMDTLAMLGFRRTSLVKTLVRADRPILVYRYENIRFSTAEIPNWE